MRADKQREAGDGFDGTWVAHPDSVPVAMEAFDEVLGDRPNQVDRQRDDVDVATGRAAGRPGRRPARSPRQGLRSNVNVGIQYISSWLRGNGAAAIYGLMEDAATAEISRGQVWQWIRHGVKLDDGRTVTPELVRELEAEELERIRAEIGDDEWFETQGRPDQSRELFEQVALRGRVRGVPDAARVRAAGGLRPAPDARAARPLRRRAPRSRSSRSARLRSSRVVRSRIRTPSRWSISCWITRASRPEASTGAPRPPRPRPHAHVDRPLDVDGDAGDRQAALLERLGSSLAHSISGLASAITGASARPCRPAAAARCPSCGAARPMPKASRMRPAIRATWPRSDSSKWSTGVALHFRTGSPRRRMKRHRRGTRGPRPRDRAGSSSCLFAPSGWTSSSAMARVYGHSAPAV